MMQQAQLSRRVRTTVEVSFEKRDKRIVMIRKQIATNQDTGEPVVVEQTESPVDASAADLIASLETQKIQRGQAYQAEIDEMDDLIAQLEAL